MLDFIYCMTLKYFFFVIAYLIRKRQGFAAYVTLYWASIHDVTKIYKPLVVGSFTKHHTCTSVNFTRETKNSVQCATSHRSR